MEVTEPALFVPAMLGLLITAFGEELFYGSIVWRALAPTGVTWAVAVTSLLKGLFYLCRLGSAKPRPEAVYLTELATGAGFTYAALRWRTASTWSVIAPFCFGRHRWDLDARDRSVSGVAAHLCHDAGVHRIRAVPSAQPACAG
ncbi:MAG: CPBP family intramembrane metalloprotease [Rubrobacter sp.]|nr:CPBP family intramembrane metalloprotease [Rubrobacter sp.]